METPLSPASPIEVNMRSLGVSGFEGCNSVPSLPQVRMTSVALVWPNLSEIPTGPVESTAAMVFSSGFDPGFRGCESVGRWYGFPLMLDVQKLLDVQKTVEKNE